MIIRSLLLPVVSNNRVSFTLWMNYSRLSWLPSDILWLIVSLQSQNAKNNIFQFDLRKKKEKKKINKWNLKWNVCPHFIYSICIYIQTFDLYCMYIQSNININICVKSWINEIVCSACVTAAGLGLSCCTIRQASNSHTRETRYFKFYCWFVRHDCLDLLTALGSAFYSNSQNYEWRWRNTIDILNNTRKPETPTF